MKADVFTGIARLLINITIPRPPIATYVPTMIAYLILFGAWLEPVRTIVATPVLFGRLAEDDYFEVQFIGHTSTALPSTLSHSQSCEWETGTTPVDP